MTRDVFLLAIALSVPPGVGVLELSPARAADATVEVARVGFVAPFSDDYSAFWKRLRELGWMEGHNLIIETRRAEGHTQARSRRDAAPSSAPRSTA